MLGTCTLYFSNRYPFFDLALELCRAQVVLLNQQEMTHHKISILEYLECGPQYILGPPSVII